jgi:hypothetical protein
VLAALHPAAAGGGSGLPDGIRLVSVPVPDGLADGDDLRDLSRFVDALSRCVPGYVERLLRETKVKWLVGDVNVGMCFEAARKLGVRVAAVFPASAACLAMLLVPQLIEGGFFDDMVASTTIHFLLEMSCVISLCLPRKLGYRSKSNDAGFPKRHGSFEITPGMPPLSP